MIRTCILLGFAALAVAAPKPEDIVPRPKAPYVQPAATERTELHQAIQGYMATPPAQVVAHPAAKDFPGAVESKARVNRSVPFDATLVARWDTNAHNAPNLATGPDAWQETGLYAAPGEVVTVKAPVMPEGRVVRVIIGCHRDSLLKLDKWQRFPVITRSFELQPGENPVANAFGGQLFIQVRNTGARKAASGAAPAAKPGQAVLEFGNAVAMPTCVLGKHAAEGW